MIENRCPPGCPIALLINKMKNELPRRKQRGIKNRIDAIAGYASADIFQGPVLAL